MQGDDTKSTTPGSPARGVNFSQACIRPGATSEPSRIENPAAGLAACVFQQHRRAAGNPARSQFSITNLTKAGFWRERIKRRGRPSLRLLIAVSSRQPADSTVGVFVCRGVSIRGFGVLRPMLDSCSDPGGGPCGGVAGRGGGGGAVFVPGRWSRWGEQVEHPHFQSAADGVLRTARIVQYTFEKVRAPTKRYKAAMQGQRPFHDRTACRIRGTPTNLHW